MIGIPQIPLIVAGKGTYVGSVITQVEGVTVRITTYRNGQGAEVKGVEAVTADGIVSKIAQSDTAIQKLQDQKAKYQEELEQIQALQ